jgi:hypothetical protein
VGANDDGRRLLAASRRSLGFLRDARQFFASPWITSPGLPIKDGTSPKKFLEEDHPRSMAGLRR